MTQIFTSRMLGVLILFSLSLALHGCASHQRTYNGDLVGTWRLISRIDRTADGRTFVEPSLGSDPISLLIYDRAGNVAAQLMRRDRTVMAPAAATGDPNNSGALNGYDAYFGTYSVDRASGALIHTLSAALVPADVGRQLVRNFRFENGDLIIWFNSRGLAGEQVTRTLTWRRGDR